MKNIILVLSLLLPFSGFAKNKESCVWEGLKWILGEEENNIFKVQVPINYDLIFVPDYKVPIGGNSANHWKKAILSFLSRPKEEEELKLWNACNLETNGKLEYELNSENKRANRIFGGWTQDSIFINDSKIGTFTYRYSAKFDSLFIVVRRADAPFPSSKTLLTNGHLSTTTTEKKATPEGANNIRGTWKFGNSYIIFDELQTNANDTNEGFLQTLSADSSQKGMMRMYSISNDQPPVQGFPKLSLTYWIKGNRLCLCDERTHMCEIPFRLSADGSEIYIVLTRSKLNKQQKELIKKYKPSY